MLRLQGQLRRSIQVYHQGLEPFQRGTAFAPGFVGRLDSLMAIPLIEQNELGQARRLVKDAIAHNRWWHNPNHDTHALLALAMLCLAEGHLSQAQAALEHAADIVAREPVVQLLRSQLEALRVQYWLAGGQPEAAQRWAEEHASLVENETPDEPQVTRQLALARVWIATGELSRALSLLRAIEPFIQSAGRVSSLMEIPALRRPGSGRPGSGAGRCVPGLILGEPQGFARVFLDLGQPMRRLLAAFTPRACAGQARLPSAAYVQSLLDAFPSLESGPASHAADSPQALVERLTERELDVLRCIAEGLTNPQIGARLYISTGTVKAHSAAIFRKLEVANRTEAVAKAKDLHLL